MKMRLNHQCVLAAGAAMGAFSWGVPRIEAAPLLFDPFNYPVSNVSEQPRVGLDGADFEAFTDGGYTAPNGSTYFATGYQNLTTTYDLTFGTRIVDQNLTVPGLAASGGNAIAYGGSGYTARVDVNGPATPAITSGSVFSSFAFQITDLTGQQPAGGFIASFNNSTGQQAGAPSVVAAPVFIRGTPLDGGGNSTSTYQIGFQKAGTTAVTFDTTQNYNLNETQFVVAQYNIVAGAGNDSATLFINPTTLGGDAPAPGVGAQIMSTAGTDITQIASFLFRQGNTLSINTPAGVIADELRIGTTFADVTPIPEPASAALLGLGVLAILGRRRRA